MRAAQCLTFWITCVLCTVHATQALAQTLTTLVNFDGTNGAEPGYGALIEATDGNLYGTTTSGGTYGAGTVFSITPSGALTTLYSFCPQYSCRDGESPYGGLIQGRDGNFYGTTTHGGTERFGSYGSNGTIFKITPSGELTVLYNFCAQAHCADGRYPYARLLQARNGNFYGTTSQGGSGTVCTYGTYNLGCGTIFSITPEGRFTTLYSFDSTEDCCPTSGLVQGNDGDLYGTTLGSVYRITADGQLTTLYAIGADYGGLVRGTDGNFYGTIYGGGNYFGSVFKMTASGQLSTLYSFCHPYPTCEDGSWPAGGLVQGKDGNFYGTTTSGGGYYAGTVFMITPAGDLTTLVSFNESDGKAPWAALLQASDGNFYGSTSPYGEYYDGTLFSLAADQFGGSSR